LVWLINGAPEHHRRSIELRITSHRAKQLDAIEGRQHDVRDDEVRPEQSRELQGNDSVRSRNNSISEGGEEIGQSV
jgi:hypothetical protein